MIVAPYSKGKSHDDFLPQVVAGVRKSLLSDDDALVMCFGTTGTGKTTLMFHAYASFTPSPLTKQIALTREDLAKALYAAKDLAVNQRFVGYDEANVSKREAMTQWNRDLIDLYSAIRGKNILHWWNNPSLDYIEKNFIEERVKFFIFCFSKDTKNVRKYWLFTKNSMLRLLEREGNLKMHTIRRVGEKYAYYQGWFAKYTGPLWDAYLDQKEDRMDSKIEAFHQRWGLGELLSMHQVGLRLGCDDKTVKKALLWGAESKSLKEMDHYIIKGSRWSLTAKGVDELRSIVENRLHTKRFRVPVSEIPHRTVPLIKYARKGKTPDEAMEE